MTTALRSSGAATARLASGCAAGTAALSAVATAISFTWLPVGSPALGAATGLVVQAVLLLTISDTRDRRLHRTAVVVGVLLGGFLLAGSAWAAATRFPATPAAVLVCVLQNTLGPLAVLSVHIGRPRRSAVSTRNGRGHR